MEAVLSVAVRLIFRALVVGDIVLDCFDLLLDVV